MPSPTSSHSSTLYTSSGPSSPGQASSGYSSGSDMHVDSPPAALHAGIVLPRPSGGPSTPPRTAPLVQLQFNNRDRSPPGRSNPSPALAPTPVLPPTPAAVLTPPIAPVPALDPAPPSASLMAEVIILGVIQGLAPYFECLFILLAAIQHDAAKAKATRK
ncbi:hypothetical protein F5146DRAFT_1142491 [Armillaria mellea]|nr:hypothetical protein F5146DRAFT_1142491 [Armillaria mellea]